jgi:hypothetical protein
MASVLDIRAVVPIKVNRHPRQFPFLRRNESLALKASFPPSLESSDKC